MGYKFNKTSDGFNLQFTCEHIVGYTSSCPECGKDTITPLRKKLPVCPICQSKRIGDPVQTKCGAKSIRYEHGTLDVAHKHKDFSGREAETLASVPRHNLKNPNHPEEWFCDDHARFHQ